MDWQILYGRRGTGKTTLLHKLADVIDRKEGYSVEKKWREHRIQEVIIRHSIGRVEDHVKKDRFLDCIFNEIGRIVGSNNHRIFLVPKSIDSRLPDAVESLFSSRLIHKQDVVAVPKTIRAEYDVYFIDYGIFLDRTRGSKHRASEGEITWPLDHKEALADVNKFVIEIERCQLTSP